MPCRIFFSRLHLPASFLLHDSTFLPLPCRTLVLFIGEPPLEDQTPLHFGPMHRRTAPTGPNVTSLWSQAPPNRSHRTKRHFTLVLGTAEPLLQDQTLRHFGPMHRRTAPVGPNATSLWSYALQNCPCRTKRHFTLVPGTAEPLPQDQTPLHFGPGHRRTAPTGPNISSLWSWALQNRTCRTKPMLMSDDLH